MYMGDDPQIESALVPFQPRPSTEKLREDLPERLRFWIETPDNVIEVNLKKELVIGRRGSTARVDVDLTPYESLEKGISRQHAILQIDENRLLLRDLNSSNGTRLNGEKLIPEHVYEVNDGDIFQLGMMLMRVFFVSTKTAKLPRLPH
ncbi:MAG: hypothetical protein CL607_28230 [Anaerolineaceae bacterium]|nr:hypothetical protein [Anaerolineaceae bacterium]